MAKKSDAYRYAVKDGWGLVNWYSERNNYSVPVNRDKEDKTQALYCDDDSSGVLYLRNGQEFCIFPDEEFFPKDFPDQADIETMIFSGAHGYDFWTKDIDNVKFFVTYDDNGLIDTYRLDNWTGKPYDNEIEISFSNLQSEDEHDKKNRADIIGTFEYEKKLREAAA